MDDERGHLNEGVYSDSHLKILDENSKDVNRQTSSYNKRKLEPQSFCPSIYYRIVILCLSCLLSRLSKKKIVQSVLNEMLIPVASS